MFDETIARWILMHCCKLLYRALRAESEKWKAEKVQLLSQLSQYESEFQELNKR